MLAMQCRGKQAPADNASKFPILIRRLDCPFELLSQRLGEELLDRDVELFGKDYGQTGIDVVL